MDLLEKKSVIVFYLKLKELNVLNERFFYF